MGKDCDARPGAVVGEFFADGGGDIRAGFEMGFFEDVVRQGAVNEDFGATLDEGLNLGLPLFGADVTGGCKAGEHFFRTF